MSESGWRPIDTAPQDGTEIIALFALRSLDGKRTWIHDFVHWRNGNGYPGWYDPRGGHWKHHQPTHWMPLPAPPEDPEPESEGET